MSEPGSSQTELDPVAEIAAALKRNHLLVTSTEIANMVEGYQFVRRGLQAVEHWLPPTAEPGLTFDSAAASRSMGEDLATL